MAAGMSAPHPLPTDEMPTKRVSVTLSVDAEVWGRVQPYREAGLIRVSEIFEAALQAELFVVEPFAADITALRKKIEQARQSYNRTGG
jgi:hypothetical protein